MGGFPLDPESPNSEPIRQYGWDTFNARGPVYRPGGGPYRGWGDSNTDLRVRGLLVFPGGHRERGLPSRCGLLGYKQAHLETTWPPGFKAKNIGPQCPGSWRPGSQAKGDVL